MGHPLVYNLPVGPVTVYPSSSSPEFFHTDPACSTFFSSAMNINGSTHSKPSTSSTSPSSTVAAAPAPGPSTTTTKNPTWKPASPSSSSSAPLTMNPSRKRSRDDYVSSTPYSIDDDQRDSGFGSTTTSSPAIEDVDPTYGEVLFNHDGTANNISSSDLRSRKLQRLDTSSSASTWDDNTMATIQAKLQSTSSSTPPNHDNNYRICQPKRQPSASSFSFSHPLTPQEPQLDSITLLLGISWQRVSRTDDEDVAAALRGWERYIQNHYTAWISQAEILLRHRGVGAFLVAGRVPFSSSFLTPITNTNADADANGVGARFYLFSENLAEARLVGNDWDSCIRNLREVPIRYEDGSVVLRASSAASAVESISTGAERVVEDKGVLIGCVNGATGGGVGDGVRNAIGMGMDMEVGMGMDIDSW
ncbi:hypothetical protein ACJ73_06457 [Blastomyces percursus]|uniref:Uncharacterized protein n=1 Tax=Blastomyces percursus TaxID=1658174 RepID=A0A1J9R3K4_9EURO|nr:hypothetical protein ACJ73_06457 [Blastomyces percursus]